MLLEKYFLKMKIAQLELKMREQKKKQIRKVPGKYKEIAEVTRMTTSIKAKLNKLDNKH